MNSLRQNDERTEGGWDTDDKPSVPETYHQITSEHYDVTVKLTYVCSLFQPIGHLSKNVS